MSDAGRYYVGLLALCAGSVLMGGHGGRAELIGCLVVGSVYFWAFHYGRRA